MENDGRELGSCRERGGRLQGFSALSSPVMTGEQANEGDGGFGISQLLRRDERQESTRLSEV